jgi:hypothetical protein
VELAAAHTKVMEVERHERALTSDYCSLCSDFSNLETAHATLVKEKVNVEKAEREKVQ